MSNNTAVCYLSSLQDRNVTCEPHMITNLNVVTFIDSISRFVKNHMRITVSDINACAEHTVITYDDFLPLNGSYLTTLHCEVVTNHDDAIIILTTERTIGHYCFAPPITILEFLPLIEKEQLRKRARLPITTCELSATENRTLFKYAPLQQTRLFPRPKLLSME